ncbi:MAG: cell wall hydrolase [Firmicutes bacterium]|nr:cell wall hydrolase [Bacillota bacterium]
MNLWTKIGSLAFGMSAAALVVGTGAVPAPSAHAIQPTLATYTVQTGDSLWSIAQAWGMSVSTLQAANRGAGWLIYPGEQLQIPQQATGTPKATTSAAPAQNRTPAVSAADRDLLSRLITAEAGGESYQAQLAVGAVILNRVKSGQFPNTIAGVIYQVDSGHYQFEPVANGWIDRPATASAKQAADEALSGVDPTGGALYFWDVTAQSAYLWSKPILAQWGGMVFAK